MQLWLSYHWYVYSSLGHLTLTIGKGQPLANQPFTRILAWHLREVQDTMELPT